MEREVYRITHRDMDYVVWERVRDLRGGEQMGYVIRSVRADNGTNYPYPGFLYFVSQSFIPPSVLGMIAESVWDSYNCGCMDGWRKDSE